jgi:hypothetical protein
MNRRGTLHIVIIHGSSTTFIFVLPGRGTALIVVFYGRSTTSTSIIFLDLMITSRCEFKRSGTTVYTFY